VVVSEVANLAGTSERNICMDGEAESSLKARFDFFDDKAVPYTLQTCVTRVQSQQSRRQRRGESTIHEMCLAGRL
jgi:hypothetical protein